MARVTYSCDFEQRRWSKIRTNHSPGNFNVKNLKSLDNRESCTTLSSRTRQVQYNTDRNRIHANEAPTRVAAAPDCPLTT